MVGTKNVQPAITMNCFKTALNFDITEQAAIRCFMCRRGIAMGQQSMISAMQSFMNSAADDFDSQPFDVGTLFKCTEFGYVDNMAATPPRPDGLAGALSPSGCCSEKCKKDRKTWSKIYGLPKLDEK
jgi:hypothetical protein